MSKREMLSNVTSAGDASYDTVQFEWFLTNWCNYQCTYCSEASNMSNKFSAGKYKLVLTRLSKVKENFTVELIGGEPTLHPNFVEILEALSNNEYCAQVEVVTNLSRPLALYQSMNLPKVRILASYHPEYHNDEFIHKLKNISNVRLTLNISDNPAHWDKTEQLLNQLDTVPFAFNILNPTDAYQPNYTTEFYTRFGKHIDDGKHNMSVHYYYNDGTVGVFNESEIIRQGLDKFTGYYCTPLRYRITHDGDILNFCTRKDQPLILTSESLKQKIICPVSNCKCDALFVFHKEKVNGHS